VSTTLDLLIIGAGPAGLSVAIEAVQAGLSYEIVERGAVTNSIVRYPLQMTFFSTPELLAIGDVPFTTPNRNPTRLEGLVYYRNVVQHYGLNIRLGEEVTDVARTGDKFSVRTPSRTMEAKNVVVATGYFDNPVLLGIPGEHLATVSHYYTEAAPYFQRNVTIIGSQNSAVEAALDLHAHHARVTMIVRAKRFGDSVKYWLKPNIENRVKSGAIKVFFESQVTLVEPDRVEITNSSTGTRQWIESDQLFALTGYQPDISLLDRLGIAHEKMTKIPSFNPDTLESNVEGIFIAGSVACGCETGTIFIENGKLHAYTIIGVIKRRLAEGRKTRSIE
jgi:thioredoxin reductase (NADPH)